MYSFTVCRGYCQPTAKGVRHAQSVAVRPRRRSCRSDATGQNVHLRSQVIAPQGEFEDGGLERTELFRVARRGDGEAGPCSGLVSGVLYERSVIIVEVVR